MSRGSDIPRVWLVGGFLLLGACSTDSPTTAPSAPAKVSADVIVEATTTTVDSIVVNLRVTPSGGYYSIGRSGVYFPPNSICEPATTSYGPTEWDKPCTPAKGDVHITARTANNGARSFIHFSPDLRFVPSANSDNWVYIYMYSADVKRAPADQRQALLDRYRIYWVPTGSMVPVDESLLDPSLATSIQWNAGWVYRRIKHFSGYQIGVGAGDKAVATSDGLLSADTDAGIGIGF